MIDLLEVYICRACGEVLADEVASIPVYGEEETFISRSHMKCGEEVTPKIVDGVHQLQTVDHERWLWAQGFYSEWGSSSDDQAIGQFDR